MAESSNSLHEPAAIIGEDMVDAHRAWMSLIEELEAVDWYDQRAAATGNAGLRSILEHNRDEEKEHAAMMLEWLRRRDGGLDQHLRTYLFSDGQITALESAEPAAAATAPDESLGIGSLKAELP